MLTIGFALPPGFQIMGLAAASAFEMANASAEERLYDIRVLSEHGEVIPGLYAVGECAVRSTGGGGYNSGYSLSRAMTFGWLAAKHILGA